MQGLCRHVTRVPNIFFRGQKRFIGQMTLTLRPENFKKKYGSHLIFRKTEIISGTLELRL